MTRSSIFDGEDTATGLLWILVGLSAVNGPLDYFTDYNVVGEVLAAAGATGGIVETIVYGVMLGVAILALADWFGIYNMSDVVDEVKS